MAWSASQKLRGGWAGTRLQIWAIFESSRLLSGSLSWRAISLARSS